MKALVVSYGSIGRRHVTNLQRRNDIEEIGLLRRPTEANKDESIEEIDRVFFEVDEAVEWSPIFAIIASPATRHVEFASRFVEKDIHVLVEKPLAASSDEARELVAQFEDRNVVGMVGYNFRFHEPLVELQRSVNDGAIGRILSFRAEVGTYLPDWRPERDYRSTVSARSELGGGALLELSHEIDLARWFGGKIDRVGALVERVSDLEMDVEDMAEITIQFESGAMGNIHLDMVQRSADRWLKVVGTEGTASWNIEADQGVLRWPDGTDDRVGTDRPTPEWNEMYERELTHFIDCVRERSVPRVTLHDGLRVIELVEAAKRSSDEGLRVAV